MKYFKILAILLTIQANVFSQQLTIIDQDYDKAKSIALKENKLILIDFYTTWCVPCKKLDKLIFQNDTLQQKLAADFILLKYDAEKDKIFNLSKKHHVGSYPTGIILTKDGYIVNRKYGFPDNDLETLEKSFFGFTNEGIQFNKENKIIKGYSNKIDISKYPKFYIDYVNRDNTKIDSTEFKKYWETKRDIFSEEYFSVLIYNAGSVPNSISNSLLNNKSKYEELYGVLDVNIALSFLGMGKFQKAILNKSRKEFDKAVEFTKKAQSKEGAEQTIKMFEKYFLMAQNKWNEVYKINESLKNKGEFDDGAINHFCWDVYEKCNDKSVIIKCVQWMKEVTNNNPDYSYLDTYACILYKSGDKIESKRIAILAIETGKKNNENTRSTEKFLKTLQ